MATDKASDPINYKSQDLRGRGLSPVAQNSAYTPQASDQPMPEPPPLFSGPRLAYRSMNVLDTTLWMNLEPGMDEAFVRDVWLRLGEEVKVKLISKGPDNLPYCAVEFRTPDAARNALKLNGTDMPTGTGKFHLAGRLRKPEGQYKLYVTHLGPDVTIPALLSLFRSRFSSCVSAEIEKNTTTGIVDPNDSFGVVEFDNKKDYERALEEMQGIVCGDRPIHVSASSPSMTKSLHTRSRSSTLMPDIDIFRATSLSVQLGRSKSQGRDFKSRPWAEPSYTGHDDMHMERSGLLPSILGTPAGSISGDPSQIFGSLNTYLAPISRPSSATPSLAESSSIASTLTTPAPSIAESYEDRKSDSSSFEYFVIPDDELERTPSLPLSPISIRRPPSRSLFNDHAEPERTPSLPLSPIPVRRPPSRNLFNDQIPLKWPARAATQTPPIPSPVSAHFDPNFEKFAQQIRESNPGLPEKLVSRFAIEQCKRFKRLKAQLQKHSDELKENGSCKNADKCRTTAQTADIQKPPKWGIPTNDGSTEWSDDDEPAVLHEAQFVFPPGIPSPPVARFPAEFECPICFKIRKFSKPSDWTKHVHEDVQPFTCTFPECSEPSSFKRRADWVRHENERHRHLDVWTCNEPDCTHTCYRKDNYVQHLVREHGFAEPMHMSDSDSGVDGFWSKVDGSHKESQKSPHSEKCRFCGQVCSTWKRLAAHLARHLEAIALPVLDLIQDEVSASEGVKLSSSKSISAAPPTSEARRSFDLEPPPPPPLVDEPMHDEVVDLNRAEDTPRDDCINPTPVQEPNSAEENSIPHGDTNTSTGGSATPPPPIPKRVIPGVPRKLATPKRMQSDRLRSYESPPRERSRRTLSRSPSPGPAIQRPSSALSDAYDVASNPLTDTAREDSSQSKPSPITSPTMVTISSTMALLASPSRANASRLPVSSPGARKKRRGEEREAEAIEQMPKEYEELAHPQAPTGPIQDSSQSQPAQMPPPTRATASPTRTTASLLPVSSPSSQKKRRRGEREEEATEQMEKEYEEPARPQSPTIPIQTEAQGHAEPTANISIPTFSGILRMPDFEEKEEQEAAAGPPVQTRAVSPEPPVRADQASADHELAIDDGDHYNYIFPQDDNRLSELSVKPDVEEREEEEAAGSPAQSRAVSPGPVNTEPSADHEPAIDTIDDNDNDDCNSVVSHIDSIFSDVSAISSMSNASSISNLPPGLPEEIAYAIAKAFHDEGSIQQPIIKARLKLSERVLHGCLARAFRSYSKELPRPSKDSTAANETLRKHAAIFIRQNAVVIAEKLIRLVEGETSSHAAAGERLLLKQYLEDNYSAGKSMAESRITLFLSDAPGQDKEEGFDDEDDDENEAEEEGDGEGDGGDDNGGDDNGGFHQTLLGDVTVFVTSGPLYQKFLNTFDAICSRHMNSPNLKDKQECDPEAVGAMIPEESEYPQQHEPSQATPSMAPAALAIYWVCLARRKARRSRLPAEKPPCITSNAADQAVPSEKPVSVTNTDLTGRVYSALFVYLVYILMVDVCLGNTAPEQGIRDAVIALPFISVNVASILRIDPVEYLQGVLRMIRSFVEWFQARRGLSQARYRCTEHSISFFTEDDFYLHLASSHTTAAAASSSSGPTNGKPVTMPGPAMAYDQNIRTPAHSPSDSFSSQTSSSPSSRLSFSGQSTGTSSNNTSVPYYPPTILDLCLASDVSKVSCLHELEFDENWTDERLFIELNNVYCKHVAAVKRHCHLKGLARIDITRYELRPDRYLACNDAEAHKEPKFGRLYQQGSPQLLAKMTQRQTASRASAVLNYWMLGVQPVARCREPIKECGDRGFGLHFRDDWIVERVLSFLLANLVLTFLAGGVVIGVSGKADLGFSCGAFVASVFALVLAAFTIVASLQR